MLNITPVVLTFNEAPNIARTLERLRWASEVVVVDSHSTDGTAGIARQFPNVRVVQRPFDCHADQWNYAITATDIASEWVLALDADYVLSDELVEEMRRLDPGEQVSGYCARFVYCVDGRPLHATLYTPVTVLYRRSDAHYWQDGHTQRVKVRGKVLPLSHPIYHDDRKSLGRWIASQARYAELEAHKLASRAPGELRWPERLRRLKVAAPFAMLLYCLFAKRMIFAGWPGVFYSFQRAFAELMLSLHLIRIELDKRLPRPKDD